jgi:GNAT superfamily N-acetyltransferase
MIALPTPYTAHRGSRADLDEIWQLLVAVSVAEVGTPGFGFEEVENWLTGFPIVIEDDVVTVRDGAGTLVGLEIFHLRDPFVRPIAMGGVHTDHVGRGLGTALLGWALQRAASRVPGAPADARVTFVTHIGAGHAPSEELMRNAGLEFTRHFVDMQIDFAGPPPPPEIPNGTLIRQAKLPSDVGAMADTIRDSFRDHYGFVETPRQRQIDQLNHWASAPNHDPGLWWVAEVGGEMVGLNLCDRANEGNDEIGLVATLGVVREHRRNGLGRALLLTAFNAFHERGKLGAALGVDADSLTGATRLYESVGMRAGARYGTWEIEVRHGIEMATVAI